MTALVVAGWLAGWVLLWRLPTICPGAPRGPRRRLAVVIPARNEAHRLPRLLADLGRQQPVPDEVIVVDDGSADATAATARSTPGVRVLPAGAVPDGWTGKSWACATGALAATGELIAFLDADVELEPGALGALLAAFEVEGGLLSVQPHHVPRRPVEALSLPFNLVGVMGLGIGSLLPPRTEWGAAGPCLITARADYERVGGHGSVKGAVAEDLALAERYRRAGLAVRCLGGGALVRFRMYRDLRGIVEGWSKNVASGARRTPRLRALAIGLWVSALLAMSLRLVEGPEGSVEGLGVLAAVYAAGGVQVWALGRQVGRFGPAALLWPALVVFFLGVFVLSVIRSAVLRRVRWSGRTVTLRRVT